MAEKITGSGFAAASFTLPAWNINYWKNMELLSRVFHSKEQELTESFPSNQEKLTILAVNRKKWDFNREAERPAAA